MTTQAAWFSDTFPALRSFVFMPTSYIGARCHPPPSTDGKLRHTEVRKSDTSTEPAGHCHTWFHSPTHVASPGSKSKCSPRVCRAPREAEGLGGDWGQHMWQVPSTPARNKGSERPVLALLCKKEVEGVDFCVKSVDFEDKSERLLETSGASRLTASTSALAKIWGALVPSGVPGLGVGPAPIS